MSPEITVALDQIRQSVPGCGVDAADDGQGGAFVTVHDVSLDGGPYEQESTWFGFHITHTYPYCDVYPHFVRPDLRRRDGKPLGEGTSVTNFRDRPAVQISRRSNSHNPATDTAALKLLKVLRWLMSR